MTPKTRLHTTQLWFDETAPTGAFLLRNSELNPQPFLFPWPQLFAAERLSRSRRLICR